MGIYIAGAELSRFFGHSGDWAQRMISRHLAPLNTDKPVSRGRPKVVGSNTGRQLIDFCLLQQSRKRPVTVEDAIQFMSENGVRVDRFWVRRFVERNSEKLAFQQAQLLDKDRHNVQENDVKRYFGEFSAHAETVPSTFVWNADET
jgi:hypothetical protein